MLLLAAAAAVTAAGLYVTYGSFVLERLASSDQQTHSDWETFWLSARALLDGQDIYRTEAGLPNLNPPIFSALIAPLGGMEFLPSYRLWVLLMATLFVASMAAVAVELRMRAAGAVPVVVAVLLSSPMVAMLGLGQMYPLLTAGLVAAWIADRRDRLALAGMALGVVVALKPSLAPVLLVPVLRRQWLTVGSALLAATGGTVAGWIICGSDSVPAWVHLLATNGPVTYWDNASLPGALLRLTSVSDWGWPIVEIPGGTVIGLILGVAVLAATAWMVRRPPAEGPDTALWAMAAAGLLASPLAWHTYLVVLMPGLLVLVACRRWPVATLLLALSLIGMEWPSLWWSDDGVSALPVSLYCGILLAYWGSLLQRPRPRPGLDLHVELIEREPAPPPTPTPAVA